EDLKKHYNQNTDAADEWSHITGVGSKIEVRDAMDISDRSIFFSNKPQFQTKQELVKEQSELFKDDINNTHQYQKFVNVLLQEKVKNVKKMLDAEKKFAEEMSFFQDASKTRPDLEKINPKYIKESDATILVKNLEEDYAKMQMRLEHEQSVIEKTKNQLQTKRQQIECLKEELSYISQKQKKEQIPDDPILTIKHELKKLGISDDSGKITQALSTLANKVKQTE
ncbi:MAG: hypothetical protein JRZ94_05060, partial [Nitrososphaerota archaeon]|nr:hypothetical protein [Nitrososphaerota archaeon]